MQRRPHSWLTYPHFWRFQATYMTFTGGVDRLETGYVAEWPSICGRSWRSCQRRNRCISSSRYNNTPRCCRLVAAARVIASRSGYSAVRNTGPAALNSHVSQSLRSPGTPKRGTHGCSLLIGNSPSICTSFTTPLHMTDVSVSFCCTYLCLWFRFYLLLLLYRMDTDRMTFSLSLRTFLSSLIVNKIIHPHLHELNIYVALVNSGTAFRLHTDKYWNLYHIIIYVLSN